jgi:intracellular sulfur oxidation DsrE/DsrF family protein
MPAIFAGTRGHESPASDLDAWFKGMRGPERVFYDCTSAASAPDGILFARNFLKFSAEKLGTKDSEMGVIVSFRHFATPYGYNDAIWAKYPQMAEMLKVNDPKTSKPAARNIPLHDEMDGFPGSSLPALLSHGVQFAVCGAATSFIAGLLAGPNGNAKAIEDEILANLIPGAKTMPAGVVAVQRAQKAGFAYTFVG